MSGRKQYFFMIGDIYMEWAIFYAVSRDNRFCRKADWWMLSERHLSYFFQSKHWLCVRLPGKFWFKCLYLLWSAIFCFKFCVFSTLPCIRVIFVARRSEYCWFMTSLKWLGRSKTKISQLERLLQRSDIFDSGTTLDNVSCIMLRNFFSRSTFRNCAIKPTLTLVLLEVKLNSKYFSWRARHASLKGNLQKDVWVHDFYAGGRYLCSQAHLKSMSFSEKCT